MDVEVIEEFIEVVQKKEILWNYSHPDYKNLKKKHDEWKKISLQFDVSLETCKKKWRALRDCYSRELTRQKYSGQDAEELNTGWVYFKCMEFLRYHVKPKPFEPVFVDLSTLEKEGDPQEKPTFFEGLEHTTVSDNNSTSNPSSNVEVGKKRKHMDLESELSETMKIVQEYLATQSVTPDTNDDDEIFGRTMISKLKRLPADGKSKAKMEISKVITEIENEYIDDYCRSMMTKLKKVPARKKNTAKMNILKLLNDIEDEYLD